MAYGFQPDLVVVALGPDHGLQKPQAALLAAMLRGPAGGRVLALLEEVSREGWKAEGGGVGKSRDSLPPPLLCQESTPQFAQALARALYGEAPPSLGPFSMASPEDLHALMSLRAQLQPRWEMLRVAASEPVERRGSPEPAGSATLPSLPSGPSTLGVPPNRSPERPET